MRGRFEVREARPGTGKGLFAREKIVQGEFIIEYTGKRIPTELADTLKTRYLFEVDKDWTVDAEDERNTARFINHSCSPNAAADIHDGRILIFAARDIAPGEEITMDYGQEYFDEFIKPTGCKCAAATHRL